MAYRVLIPTPLRPYTGQQEAVELEGGTVGEILAALTTRYADLRRHQRNRQLAHHRHAHYLTGSRSLRATSIPPTSSPGATLPPSSSATHWVRWRRFDS